jgi:hypothetical protein
MTKIVAAARRDTAAPRGAKVLLLGPTGVGKTSLLRTVALPTTLFVNVEAGDLAVQDLALNSVRPRTWPDCRNLAVALAGADPAVSDSAVYSAGHYAAVKDQFGDLSRFDTVFIDSITAVGRSSFAWACQQPEAFSDRSGKKDLRGAYGLHAREMISWLLHLQQASGLNIVFVGILETVTDDFNRTEHRLQLEGSRTGRELPGIVDQVVTMNWISMGADAALTRALICTAPNQWRYPAKDRSGRLDQIEEPDLGKLLDKLTRPRATVSVSDLQSPSSETPKEK